jgi:hypothetical protein
MVRGIRSPRWGKWWDRIVPIGYAGIFVFGFYGIIDANNTSHTNTALIKHSIKVSNLHHISNITQQKEIIGLQKRNHVLATANNQLLIQGTNDINQINAYAAWITQVNNLECVALHLGCPAPPPS